MFAAYDAAEVHHVPHKRHTGQAAEIVLSRADFATARSEITTWQGYDPTPLYELKALARELGLGNILYKDEGPRFGLGSFKALGGAYAALRVLQREVSKSVGAEATLSDIRKGKYAGVVSKITLISATDGNHGRSLAWGCQRFGAPCRIYIHAEVSEGRAQAMRDLGAEVVRIDGDYDASVELARSEAEANGWFVVSDTSWEGYSDPPRDVMSGYGVMVQEITDALETPPSHVILQGGVGGLAAGVCAAFRQHWGEDSPRVVIAEPDLAACLFESAKAGEMRSVPINEETVMAGLSCGEPSAMAWEILDDEASDFLTIPDVVVGPTVRLLARPLPGDPEIQAGESAVAGLAAVIAAARRTDLSKTLNLDETSTVLVIGSEGITDPEIYAQMMQEDAHA